MKIILMIFMLIILKTYRFILFQEDGRYLLESSPEGSWLVIRLVSPEDRGVYTCQVQLAGGQYRLVKLKVMDVYKC